MKILILAVGFSVLGSGAAMAQVDNNLCYHAGLTYSPGSMVRMGKSLQKCLMTDAGISSWVQETSEDTNVASANCASGGREFGQGSILPAGVESLKCSNGIWYIRQPQ